MDNASYGRSGDKVLDNKFPSERLNDDDIQGG